MHKHQTRFDNFFLENWSTLGNGANHI